MNAAPDSRSRSSTNEIEAALDRFERSAVTWERHMTDAHGPGPETCASPKAMCLARQLTWEAAAIDLRWALNRADNAEPPADFADVRLLQAVLRFLTADTRATIKDRAILHDALRANRNVA